MSSEPTPEPKPKRPTPDQSWRQCRREFRERHALPSRPRPDYAAMRDAQHRAVGTSKQIAARKAKAEAQARVAREATAARAQVQRAFHPPAGRLFGVDVEAMMLVGPGGGIGVTPLLARTFSILATPGRHAPESLLAAGWRDADHLGDGLAAAAGKLAVIGLVANRRKTGLRITKLKAL